MPDADVVIKIRTELINQQKVLKDATNHMKGLSGVSKKSMEKVANAQQTVWKQQQKLNLALGGFKGKLLMGSLSMLFFGQALQRVFQSAWQMGTKTFNEIMHSVEGTVTGFDILNGSLTYLGFTVGQALEPIATLLAPVVMMIADWVTENQELAAGILITVGVLGTVLFVLGTIGSAITGIISLVGLIAPIFLSTIVPILALVAAGILLWQTNLGGFRDFVKNTLGVIFESFKSIFGSILSFFKKLFSGDIVGAYKEFQSLLLKLLLGLGAIIGNIFIWVGQTVKGIFFGIIDWIVKAVISLIKLINKIPGVNISTSGLDAASKQLQEWGKADTSAYFTADEIKNSMTGIDTMMGTGSSSTTNNNQVITNNYNITGGADAFLKQIGKSS